MLVKIKPLSVNQCWQGRRFKTKSYASYEKELLLKLRPIKLPPAPYFIDIKVGYSNWANDVDNCIKPALDILSKKYLFNDKDIKKLTIEKEIVKKGQEYINFEIYGI